MPDIPALTAKVQELERSFDWWSNKTILLTAVAAFVAGLYFFASWYTNHQAGLLRQAQDALVAAKDEQLATDSKNKDVEIGHAQKDAAQANKDAAHANERAGALEATNLTLRANVATLETEAAAQQVRAAQAEQQLAKIRNPRVLPDSFLAALKAAPPGKAFMAYQTGDQETFAFALAIYYALREAHWEVPLPHALASTETALTLTPEMLPMSISGMLAIRSEIHLEMRDLVARPTYLDVLAKALQALHLPMTSVRNGAVPEDAVVIIIGPKTLQ